MPPQHMGMAGYPPHPHMMVPPGYPPRPPPQAPLPRPPLAPPPVLPPGVAPPLGGTGIGSLSQQGETSDAASGSSTSTSDANAPPPPGALVGARSLPVPASAAEGGGAVTLPPPKVVPQLRMVGPRINVYVGKLPSDVSMEDVQGLLRCCGRLEKWNPALDPVTGSSKGFGFATYRSGTEAALCIKALNGLNLKGSVLLVKVGKKDQEHVEEAMKPREGDEIQAQEQREEEVRDMVHFEVKRIEQGPTPAEAQAEAFLSESVPAEEADRVKETEVSQFLEVPMVNTNGEGGGVDFETAKLAFSEAIKFRRDQEERERRAEERRKEAILEKIRLAQLAHLEQKERAPSGPAEVPPHVLNGTAAEEAAKQAVEAGEVLRPSASQAKPDQKSASVQEVEIDAAEVERRKRRRMEVLEALSGDAPSSASAEDTLEGGDASAPGPVGFTMASSSRGVKKATTKVVPAVGAFVQDSGEEAKPIRSVVPIDYTEEEKAGVGRVSHPSQPQVDDKVIVDAIPKETEALFAYAMDWGAVARHDIVSSHMRPWVIKKVKEYLGAEEPTLIDFICSKLQAGTTPQELLEELKLVLDADAENFTILLWRMLIFCILKVTPRIG
jgi:hypothetical protein